MNSLITHNLYTHNIKLTILTFHVDPVHWSTTVVLVSSVKERYDVFCLREGIAIRQYRILYNLGINVLQWTKYIIILELNTFLHYLCKPTRVSYCFRVPTSHALHYTHARYFVGCIKVSTQLSPTLGASCLCLLEMSVRQVGKLWYNTCLCPTWAGTIQYATHA